MHLFYIVKEEELLYVLNLEQWWGKVKNADNSSWYSNWQQFKWWWGPYLIMKVLVVIFIFYFWVLLMQCESYGKGSISSWHIYALICWKFCQEVRLVSDMVLKFIIGKMLVNHLVVWTIEMFQSVYVSEVGECIATYCLCFMYLENLHANLSVIFICKYKKLICLLLSEYTIQYYFPHFSFF